MGGANTRKERPAPYLSLELLPIHLYVLVHLKKANVEYAKMIVKMTELPLGMINSAITDLMEAGLVERDSGSAVKRSKARFKKAFEVHKHHTYYRLSREGELFVRSIDEKWLKCYFNAIFPDGWKFIGVLIKSRDFEDTCKKAKAKNCAGLKEELILYRFITSTGRKTRFFKLFCKFLGL
ncbi:DUF2250 domain-containing protein [Thermococcus sp. GR6]|uniref:DUF2250 domain-containing protein n=1 Tax=Thermococcus sp. GR6 TaxID=1638256 RepID=UPI0014320626|nr:DUF2250 domain-containing protein [Thermococcus sp. GR6]NJE41877.1 DUF2250 domain-containing protein [Thermococcus sp. GR6]